MIRSYFGLTDNPFTLRDIELLEHQQEIHDTLNVHCQQGGLCLVVGSPGTGKSVIKESLKSSAGAAYRATSRIMPHLAWPMPRPRTALLYTGVQHLTANVGGLV